MALLPIFSSPCTRPMEVTVLPSPEAVGVVAVTRISLPRRSPRGLRLSNSRLSFALTGERRSSKDIRLAQQVRRVEWRATGGELGAMLAEAQWIAKLRPGHNRVPRVAKSDPADAPWPFEGPIVFEEREEASQARAFHIVDRWRYVGHAASLAEAAALYASNAAGAFELSTYRILQSHLARGLRVMPLSVSSATLVANVA